MICLFLWTGVCHAQGDQSLQLSPTLWDRVRDGRPPDPASYQKHHQAGVAARETLPAVRLVRGSPACTMFYNVWLRLYDEIAVLQDEVFKGHSDKRVYRIARLYVLNSLSLTYHQMLMRDHDGGLSLLAGSSETCRIADRDHWKIHAQAVAREFNAATPALLGVFGDQQMTDFEQVLLKMIAAKENADRQLAWVSGIGTAGLSIALWYAVPATVAVLSTGTRVMSTGALFGMRTLAIGAEITAMKWMDENYFFYDWGKVNDRRLLLGWKDFLNSTQMILDAPLESPRIYFEFMSQAFSLISRQLLQSLSTQVIWPAKAQVTMASINHRAERLGRSTADAAALLLERIRADYGYEVSCDESILSGISPWNCLQGAQSLLKALQRSPDEFNPALLGIAKINLGWSWSARKMTWSHLEVWIPFAASPAEIHRYLHYQLEAEGREYDRQFLMDFYIQMAEIGPVIVQMDDDLRFEEVKRGCILLKEVLNNFTDAEIRELDPIVLGHSSERFQEEGEKRIRLDVNAGVGNATGFLRGIPIAP